MDSTIEAKLAAGLLPRHRPVKSWADFGTGNACDGCDESILATEVEHELDFAESPTLRLHGDRDYRLLRPVRGAAGCGLCGACREAAQPDCALRGDPPARAAGDVTLRAVADDIIESRVRGWLRDHQGSAHCARCVARDLHIDVALARAAMDDLSTRQTFSRGPCTCGMMGLAYGWSSGGAKG